MPDVPIRRSVPASPVAKIQKKPGAPKAKGAVRAKSGCYTCRIRRKKCDEQPNSEGSCQTCVRLRLQCLGFGAKRPEWMREPDSVPVLREKIKSFLASQGMIKGHSGPGPRSNDQQPQILVLCDRSEPGSPQTPTLSASSSEGHRSPALHATSYVRDAPEYPISLDPPSYNAPSGSLSTHPFPPLNPYTLSSGLHPSSMQDLHHHPQHHQHSSSSFVSSRGPSFPNDIMLHPYGPGASNVLPSPNSLVPMCPPNSWLNPSPSYSSTSSVSSSNSLVVSTAPAQQSSFSLTYTQNYAVDEAFDDENVDDQTPTTRLSVSVTPDRQHELVHHYMANVLKIQYLLADQSISSFIFNLAQTSSTARDAVCLLSSLHRHCVRDNITFTSAIPNLGGGAAHPYNDTDTFYYRLRSSLLRKDVAFNEGEAMACLHVVSSFLFSGGRGDWDLYLSIATRYVQSVFDDPHYYNAEDVLRNCSDSTRFIIKTTMWFDVLSSVTQMRVPRFLQIYRTLFGPRSEAYIDSGFPPTLSMLPIMGCENHIVLAIAEISNLFRWKQLEARDGTLSIPQLVERGLEIESKFLQESSTQFGSDPYLNTMPSNAYSDTEAQEVYQRRRLTNDIFRASAKVYLHTVLSGDHPSSPEISAAVTETIDCLRQVPQANSAALSRSVVRSVVFGICICGCLTDQPSQQGFLRQLLEQQEMELVGNVVAVRRLMEEVWTRRATGSKMLPVNWREVMCEGGRDLLLLV